MTSNKAFRNLWVAMIVVAIIAIVGVFTPVGQSAVGLFGGVTNYDEVDATAIKIGGANGSRVGPIISTTCPLQANFSIVATTTRSVPCAVTGVVAGDIVQVTLPATTTIAGQYVIVGATASSTSGQIDISILNLTGQSAVPAATNGFGSTTNVTIMHPVSTVPGL